LLFYARLKGIPPEQENEAKMQALKSVSLQAFEDRLTKGLSGGEKRRLSIAIALLGDPRVVFLDEPTTGLVLLFLISKTSSVFIYQPDTKATPPYTNF
jgi:ABC-type multidrug transport system ATPase subunit